VQARRTWQAAVARRVHESPAKRLDLLAHHRIVGVEDLLPIRSPSVAGEAGAKRLVPPDLEVAGEPSRVHEIDRAISYYLIGDPRLAELRVLGLGDLHIGSVRPCARHSQPTDELVEHIDARKRTVQPGEEPGATTEVWLIE
jgi:hypothetical protein